MNLSITFNFATGKPLFIFKVLRPLSWSSKRSNEKKKERKIKSTKDQYLVLLFLKNA